MLEDIKKNIEKLVALYENEKQARIALTEELEKAKSDIETYRQQIYDLERQVDNLKLTEAFTIPSDGDTSVAKERIDKLIREIDKCISLLEK